MRAPPKILRPPRQHQRTNGHRHDSELDRMITNHRNKHARRFAMFGISPGDLLARHLATHTTTSTRRL